MRQLDRGHAGERRGVPGLLLIALASSLASAGAGAADDHSIRLTLRSRVEAPGLGAPLVVETPASWDARKTAVIVCDMWDLHHCLNATRRCGELAPRIDALLKSLRSQGALVIHAPSGCVEAYKDHPARRRAVAVTRSRSLPADIGLWCRKVPKETGSYPVDQTDGGEDDDPAEHATWATRLTALGRNPRAPWKRQTDAIAIDPEHDLISDDGAEIWSATEERGVENVILVGVHLNMCVLGRPFGLRQMARNGRNVVLLRDLTDTMYSPLRAPYVSHFTGTDRVVEHVEAHVCPSSTSDQVLGGVPFRFYGDLRPRVAFLVADDEYKTGTTLPAFAARQLGKDFQVSFLFDKGAGQDELTGLGALDEADVLVVSARRRLLPAAQLAQVQRFVASGKGVIGIRTASHAFSPRGKQAVPEGRASWQDFDPEVLGGHYQGHHPPGPAVAIAAVPASAAHPLLKGVDPSSLKGHGTLYKVSPLTSSATPVLTGTIPDQPAEPVVWTNLSPTGGRVVTTSLGHPDDFDDPAFERLLRNAIHWTSRREVPASAETSSTSPIPFPR